MLKQTTAGFFLAVILLTSCSSTVKSPTTEDSDLLEALGFRFTMPEGLDEPSLDNQTMGSNGVWKLKFGPLNPTGTQGCSGGDCYAWTLSSVPPEDPSRKLDEIAAHPEEMELVSDKMVNDFRMLETSTNGECKSVNTTIYMPDRTVNLYVGCSLYDTKRANDYESFLSSIQAL